MLVFLFALGRMRRPVSLSRTPWTDEQRQFVRLTFRKYIHGEGLPGKVECSQVIQANSFLANRKWQNIKDFVRNEQKKMKYR